MVIDSLSVTVMDFTNDESSYMFMVILSFDALSGHPFLMMFIVLSFDGLGEMLYDTPYMGYSFFKILEKPRDFDPFGQTGLSPFGYNMIDPLKSWCWGSILFYPFKISRFS